DRLFVIPNGFFLLTEIVAEEGKPPGRSIKKTLVRRFGFLQNAVRFQQKRFRFRAITCLVQKCAKLFVTERKCLVVFAEGAFRQLEQRFGDTNCFWQTIAGPQRFELVVKNAPEFLLAFHARSPAFAQLCDQAISELFRGQWKRLALIRGHIGANEKAGCANYFSSWADRLAVRTH